MGLSHRAGFFEDTTPAVEVGGRNQRLFLTAMELEMAPP